MLQGVNKTTVAQPIVVGGVVLTVIPPSSATGVSGKPWDVTKELRPDTTVDPNSGVSGGRSAAEFATLQTALVTAGSVVFQWTGTPEYLTDGLSVAALGSVGLPTTQTIGFTAQLGMLQRMDPTGGAFAVTLPAVAAFNKGQRIELKNASASVNAITLTPNGVQTIDGAAFIMNTARQAVTLISDGVSNWEVL